MWKHETSALVSALSDTGVDISAVDIGVPISVDGGVDISRVDIGFPIGVVINVDICAPIGVDSWTSKHIKSFDGGLMLGL